MAAHAHREETRAELVCKNVAIERGRANVRSHPGSEGVVAGKKWKNSERTLFRGNTLAACKTGRSPKSPLVPGRRNPKRLYTCIPYTGLRNRNPHKKKRDHPCNTYDPIVAEVFVVLNNDNNKYYNRRTDTTLADLYVTFVVIKKDE